MSFKGFFSSLFQGLNDIENKMQYSARFSQNEINEMLQAARKENVEFLQELAKISKLTVFEITFLMNSATLTAEKIETIKTAVELYDEAEFMAAGQTLSDFVFRVSANLDALNASNIELFKDLVQCKSELYDFTEVLKRPMKQQAKARKREMSFAFERVLL